MPLLSSTLLIKYGRKLHSFSSVSTAVLCHCRQVNGWPGDGKSHSFLCLAFLKTARDASPKRTARGNAPPERKALRCGDSARVQAPRFAPGGDGRRRQDSHLPAERDGWQRQRPSRGLSCHSADLPRGRARCRDRLDLLARPGTARPCSPPARHGTARRAARSPQPPPPAGRRRPAPRPLTPPLSQRFLFPTTWARRARRGSGGGGGMAGGAAAGEAQCLSYAGCNFLRQRLVLSTLSGRPLKIRKIRAKEEDPGLRGERRHRRPPGEGGRREEGGSPGAGRAGGLLPGRGSPAPGAAAAPSPSRRGAAGQGVPTACRCPPAGGVSPLGRPAHARRVAGAVSGGTGSGGAVGEGGVGATRGAGWRRPERGGRRRHRQPRGPVEAGVPVGGPGAGGGAAWRCSSAFPGGRARSSRRSRTERTGRPGTGAALPEPPRWDGAGPAAPLPSRRAADFAQVPT